MGTENIGRETESAYWRRAIVSESDLREAVEKPETITAVGSSLPMRAPTLESDLPSASVLGRLTRQSPRSRPPQPDSIQFARDELPVRDARMTS